MSMTAPNNHTSFDPKQSFHAHHPKTLADKTFLLLNENLSRCTVFLGVIYFYAFNIEYFH